MNYALHNNYIMCVTCSFDYVLHIQICHQLCILYTSYEPVLYVCMYVQILDVDLPYVIVGKSCLLIIVLYVMSWLLLIVGFGVITKFAIITWTYIFL